MAASIIKQPVLVLNKSWSPIRVSCVERALVGLSKGVLSALDPENYILYDWAGWQELPVFEGHKFLTTGKSRKTGDHLKVRAPSIVVLGRYNKIPCFTVKLNMKNLWLRDGGRCQYTGKKLTLSEATKDHVHPESRGGKDTWDNLVTCCPDINKRKANRTPAEAGLTLLKIPREPRWSPLFTALYSVSKPPEDWKPFLPNMTEVDAELRETAARMSQHD